VRHTTPQPETNDRFIEVRVLDAIPAPASPEDAGKLMRHAWTFHLESTETPEKKWIITRPDDFSAQGFRRAFDENVPVKVPEIELERDAEPVQL
jgi:hypothetical protein